MESILEFGLETTRWLQANYPQLAGFFKFITDFGREEFYLAIFPLIYWCVDKNLGKHLGYVFLLTVTSNDMLKHFFRSPRTFWLDKQVALIDESGYGIPSGHTQFATVLYFFLAAWLKRGWVWILAILIVILMGLSRIYLGVHFVHDVVIGFLVGIVILLAYFVWKQRYATGIAKRILGQRMLFVMAVPIMVAIVYIVVMLLLGAPNMDVPWAEFIPDAETGSIRGVARSIGLLVGFGIGIVMEPSRIRFNAKGAIWKRVVRYALGMVITVAIWAGLDMVFPEDPMWLGLPLRILRYTLTLLWVSYYGPAVFVLLKLADADPEPQIDLKI